MTSPNHMYCLSCILAEGTFRPERIRAIASRFNLDTEAVLDNVRERDTHTCTHAFIEGLHSPVGLSVCCS